MSSDEPEPALASSDASSFETDATERVPRPVVETPDGAPVGAFIELTPPGQVARAALERAKAGAKSRGIYPGQAAKRRSPLDPPRGAPGR